jgi:Ni/Co efflux regulator RcnB
MKKQLGNVILCGALLFASGAVMAQDYSHDHGDPHYAHNDHGGPGMYDRGHREGWYRRGGRVPVDYRGGHYVVNDWRGNHLRQPPRGYHWVRSDNGDFLLVAVSTGIIASILAH